VALPRAGAEDSGPWPLGSARNRPEGSPKPPRRCDDPRHRRIS
jgi:hypothetical protein